MNTDHKKIHSLLGQKYEEKKSSFLISEIQTSMYSNTGRSKQNH